MRIDPRRPGDAVLYRYWCTLERLESTPTPRALVINIMRALYLQAIELDGDRRCRIYREGARLVFEYKVVKP